MYLHGTEYETMEYETNLFFLQRLIITVFFLLQTQSRRLLVQKAPFLFKSRFKLFERVRRDTSAVDRPRPSRRRVGGHWAP